MRSLDFFSCLNHSSRTFAQGSTEPLTDMSTKNLPGGKGRPARKADSHAAICEPIVYKMWEPQCLGPCGPSRPVTGITLNFANDNIII
jgi:hypothetical protein